MTQQIAFNFDWPYMWEDIGLGINMAFFVVNWESHISVVGLEVKGVVNHSSTFFQHFNFIILDSLRRVITI